MKRIAYLWRGLRRIKTWHLVLMFIVLALFSVILLRQNNNDMSQLRDQVVEADKTLDIKAVESAAENLRAYSSEHMNADTGQIALQNLYNQAVAQAFSAVNNDVDSSAYSMATESCKSVLAQTGYRGYANCVAETVGLSENDFKTPDLPNPALYYISYASPLISFDFTGVVVIFTSVIFLVIVLKWLTEVVLGIILRNRGQK